MQPTDADRGILGCVLADKSNEEVFSKFPDNSGERIPDLRSRIPLDIDSERCTPTYGDLHHRTSHKIVQLEQSCVPIVNISFIDAPIE